MSVTVEKSVLSNIPEERQGQLGSLARFILNEWRRSTFAVMLFGYVGYYICRKNLSAALPLMAETFKFTNSDLGLIGFWSTFAYALGKLVNGPLADKIGGRKIFLIGMLGAIVSNVLFSLGSTITYFIVIWCICNYFLSAGWGGIAKTIGAWYEPEKNGTVMGLISVNFQFGGVVSTLIAGGLVYLGCTWDKLFLYPAAILMVIFVWSVKTSKASPQEIIPGCIFGPNAGKKKAIISFDDEECVTEFESKSSDKGVCKIPVADQKSVVDHASAPEDAQIADPKKVMKKLLSMPVFRQLLVFSFVTTFLRNTFFFWTPKFLVDIGMSTSSGILKSALFPLLGCVGTILLGWYTDKHVKNGDRAQAMWMMLTGLVVSLGLVAFIAGGIPVGPDSMGVAGASSSSLTLIVWLLGAAGFFLLGPYSMSSGALTLDIAGAKGAGSCTGLIDCVGYIGAAVAAWGTGKLSDVLGWSQVFWILTAISVLAVGSAYLMSRHFQKIYESQKH
jgi:OPA family glycerol-3-phosphate transporter-like MFS transporter